MKKDIIVFDVDGTLCESSKQILEHHAILLNKLKEHYDIAICGGGTLSKILNQINDKILFDHYFSECGCVYDKNNKENNKLELQNIYTKNIREHKNYKKINILLKVALRFFSNVDYILTGHFIDLRCGIIYISCIGMQATDEERTYFKKLNKDECIRKQLLELLIQKAIEINSLDEISITYGGTVGIAIYPKEYDKIQILPTLKQKYDKIIYFGDRHEKNGNDYTIIHSNHVIGHKINNVEETYDILHKVYLH